MTVPHAGCATRCSGECTDVEVRWTERGGHVGVPNDLDLGVGDTGALEPQIDRWLMRHA